MKSVWMGATLGALLLAGGAWAHNGDGSQSQCVKDAKAEAKTCVQVCKNNLQAAKDTCKNIDHACAETARDALEACVQTQLTEFQQCVDTECTGLEANLEACRQQFPSFSEERWQCIKEAKVDHFQCRQSCRVETDLTGGLKQCKADFRTAIAACPPPSDDDDDDDDDDDQGENERRGDDD